MRIDEEMIREALRCVVDPELHLNIIDLGLVYAIDQPADGEVQITMTLTTPGCPIGSTLVQAVERVLAPIPGVKRVRSTSLLNRAGARSASAPRAAPSWAFV